MEDIERRLIEFECARLVTAYSHRVDLYRDAGVGERVADLFSADGAFVSPMGTMKGRAELVEGFQRLSDANTSVTRHVCANALCEVVDEDHAEGVVYVTL